MARRQNRQPIKIIHKESFFSLCYRRSLSGRMSSSNAKAEMNGGKTLHQLYVTLIMWFSAPENLFLLCIRCGVFVPSVAYLYFVTSLSKNVHIHSVFPSLFLICTWLFASYGVFKYKDHLLIPFMLTVFFDTVHGIICCVFLVSIHTSDRHALLNMFLYDYWPEKAAQLVKLNRCCYQATFSWLCWFILSGVCMVITYVKYIEARKLQKKWKSLIDEYEEDECCQTSEKNG